MHADATYGDALRETLYEAFEADPTRIFLGEDIAAPGDAGGVFGISRGFLEAFGPARILNMPISESGFVGMATGAAMTGLKPVVEVMFCDFLGVTMDPILSAAAKARFLSGGKQSVPLILRTTMGAGDGSGAVHSQSLAHLLASVAGLQVALPADVLSAREAMQRALTSDDPVIIFEHKGLYSSAEKFEPTGTSLLEMQSLRAGSDLVMIAVSAMAHTAMKAAEHLAAEHGLHAAVLNPVWINGRLSGAAVDALRSAVREAGEVIIIDEGAHLCGLADWLTREVTEHCFDLLRHAPRVITPPHDPVPYAPALEALWLPGVSDIVQEAIHMKGLT